MSRVGVATYCLVAVVAAVFVVTATAVGTVVVAVRRRGVGVDYCKMGSLLLLAYIQSALTGYLHE